MWPGAGQVYNGQRLKGGFFVLGSLVLAAALVVVLFSALVRIVPEDAAPFDFALAFRLAHQVLREESRLTTCVRALVVLWVWSSVDAYVVGRRAPAVTPPSSESPSRREEDTA